MPKTFPAPAAYTEGEMPDIPLTPVESNQVAAIGHDEATKTLAVQFKRGAMAIYQYPNVERETYEAFLKAESIGTFFGQHIKPLPFNKYAPPKVEPAAAVEPAAVQAA